MSGSQFVTRRWRVASATAAVALLAGAGSAGWPRLASTPWAVHRGPTSADWAGYLNGPQHTSYNPAEKTITAANAAKLRTRWERIDISFLASPTVADGSVFVGSADGEFYKFGLKHGATQAKVFLGLVPKGTCSDLIGVADTAAVAVDPRSHQDTGLCRRRRRLPARTQCVEPDAAVEVGDSTSVEDRLDLLRLVLADSRERGHLHRSVVGLLQPAGARSRHRLQPGHRQEARRDVHGPGRPGRRRRVVERRRRAGRRRLCDGRQRAHDGKTCGSATPSRSSSSRRRRRRCWARGRYPDLPVSYDTDFGASPASGRTWAPVTRTGSSTPSGSPT